MSSLKAWSTSWPPQCFQKCSFLSSLVCCCTVCKCLPRSFVVVWLEHLLSWFVIIFLSIWMGIYKPKARWPHFDNVNNFFSFFFNFFKHRLFQSYQSAPISCLLNLFQVKALLFRRRLSAYVQLLSKCRHWQSSRPPHHTELHGKLFSCKRDLFHKHAVRTVCLAPKWKICLFLALLSSTHARTHISL